MQPKISMHFTKTPPIISNVTNLNKKKKVAFRNSFVKFPRDSTDQSRKNSILINSPTTTPLPQIHPRPKSRFPLDSLTNLYLNIQSTPTRLSQNKIQKTDESQISNPRPTSRNELFLTMFNKNVASTAESSSSIIVDEPRFTSYGKIIVSRKIISSKFDDEGPFQAIQKEIQTKKQALKQKSLSGLEKLSKKLMKNLASKQKFDERTLLMRQRYLSYINSKIQKKSPFSQTPSNRPSVQRSHQNARSRYIDGQMGQKSLSPTIRTCVKDCLKLIDSCRQDSREQALRKQVNIFTIYSKDFEKRCQRKLKSIELIKRAL